MPITVTIDWPAWSGKWTTAKKLAEKLGFKYFDSGSMYRALGVYLAEKGVDIDHVTSHDLANIEIDFSADNHVQINGEDHDWKIRTVEASVSASKLSAQKESRELVISSGRKIVEQGDYVLDGRDTGTIWFPGAQLKIYLIADAAVRAHRRWLELREKWEDATEEEVLQKIRERDERDMNRADGPLCKAEDAYEIDTTHLTIDEQVEQIYQIYQSHINL